MISDVAPDGTAHPLMAGRLLSSYPDIDPNQSVYDPVTHALVRPFSLFDGQEPAAIGVSRLYHVEIWPIGNRFKKGHRIRLQIVGTSAASLPTLPALNSVRVGGPDGARLKFPVLPGSDLAAALAEV